MSNTSYLLTVPINRQEDIECTEPRIARRMDDHAAAPTGETTTTVIESQSRPNEQDVQEYNMLYSDYTELSLS